MRFLTTLAEEKRCARIRGVLERMTCVMVGAGEGRGGREYRLHGGQGRAVFVRLPATTQGLLRKGCVGKS